MAIYFKKDLKKFIGFRLASIAFVSTAIFVVGLIFNGHTILKELPILIPAVSAASYAVSYFFSFYLVKVSYKARLFEGRREVLEKLCKELSIKVPKLYMFFGKEPKAFSLYGFRKAIFISDSLLEKLKGKELGAVLLHELYHLKRKSGLFKNMLNSISGLNFRIIPAPVAELERYEEEEIDKVLLVRHGINMNLVRDKLWRPESKNDL